MKFVCYYQEHELPLVADDYSVIADREIYGYQYNMDDESYFAIRVENNLYSVYVCAEDEIDEENLVRKAHEMMRLYRETKGVQSRHLSASTIRQIETMCHIHKANITFSNDEGLVIASNGFLEKRHFVRNAENYWGITYNNKLLILLTSENDINRIFSIIDGDVLSYIIQRWGRFLNH